MSRPTVDVQIWSDVMCPWCAIGYAQYAKALAELDGEIDVETRWMPFELNPDMPPEGKSQAQHLAETYNRSEDELSAMRRRLSEKAAEAGFPIPADEPAGQPGMMWNTFDAHKLLRWALAVEGPEAQTRLSQALFRAHFQERRSIGDREVLLDIAEAENFDRGAAAEALDEEALGIAVRLEEKRGLEAGINSVPSFVVNGKYLIPGAQEPAVFSATLRRVAAMAAGEVRNA
ncbi:DsbA family oxidoreductase [Altererythrobacter soli]|uniref:DsbA family oxidoreductase n=1 Tax=Croceibacterium soli TaxID=1739690 RepID=A0A6I4UVG8_9SPHN|nr:DsbA family oxidoreductase [Croceibacterium soli]MXP42628.1 DsbA family oxidoreductase [Croceibacterium soli]